VRGGKSFRVMHTLCRPGVLPRVQRLGLFRSNTGLLKLEAFGSSNALQINPGFSCNFVVTQRRVAE